MAMFDEARRFQLVSHLTDVNQSLRSESAALVRISRARIARSDTLVAAVLSTLVRADMMRASLRPEWLVPATAEASGAAEVLTTLIRLREIRRRFIRHRDRSALVNEVLDVVTRAVGTDLGNVQLLNPRRRALVIVAQRGFDAEFLDFFSEVHGEGAACGAAMRRRQRVIVDDVETHPL